MRLLLTENGYNSIALASRETCDPGKLLDKFSVRPVRVSLAISYARKWQCCMVIRKRLTIKDMRFFGRVLRRSSS
jgi:hypothetical protein